MLTAGGISNYKPELQMNHIYFTANTNGAGLAATLAKGEGKERVYIIEPTGEFENDPNVTDKKFPGNLTRSYRSKEPLRIIGEETECLRLFLSYFTDKKTPMFCLVFQLPLLRKIQRRYPFPYCFHI